MIADERIYGQFCPIAMGAEIFATKWTPLILRELILGSTRFAALHRGVPLISRSLLSQRLRELERAGLVKIAPQPSGRGAEYRLTESGEAMRPVVMALGDWANSWLEAEIPDHNLDPALLMWDIRRNVAPEAFPSSERTVVAFEIGGVPRNVRHWWLLVERGTAELCQKWPGFEHDLDVSGHIRDLTNIWLGRLRLGQAVATGKLTLAGPRRHKDAFARWFLLSPFGRHARDQEALASA